MVDDLHIDGYIVINHIIFILRNTVTLTHPHSHAMKPETETTFVFAK